MLKRLFGLLAFALLGWLVWRWWQERTEDLFIAGPQLAPTVLPPERPGHSLPTPADEPAPPADEPVPPTAETPAAAPAPDETAAAPEESGEPEAGEEEGEEEGDTITGYCVRCRAKRLMQNAQVEITENGRRGARGTCPVCGSTMFRFLKEAKVED